MATPPLLRLSQGQLNLLQTCPRKFQHVYLDQLAAPLSPDEQAKLAWGSRFHLLMQQRELGLPTRLFSGEPDALQASVETLLATIPERIKASPGQSPQQFRQSEYRLSLDFQGYLLTVIYDLIVIDPQGAAIVDWKTYAQPPKRIWLKDNWQTRLYPFVLTEVMGIAPARVSLTYWFIPPGGSGSQPLQSMRFDYDDSQHRAIRMELTQLLQQLTVWIQDYQRGVPFPQIPPSARCDACQFAQRCDRHPDSSDAPRPSLPQPSEIEEVAL
ncbi:MAG: PD-(D/E)XK nuclease family protein [Synechococcales bacterium]|nr:PD-(D/E)XK nuclease family protein [Synechococcales bacterium]